MSLLWQKERIQHMPEHNAADLLSERLRAIGVQIKASSYEEGYNLPSVYTVSYANIEARGATLDLALISFVEKLLMLVPVEKL
jgi:hypothetical protein